MDHLLIDKQKAFRFLCCLALVIVSLYTMVNLMPTADYPVPCRYIGKLRATNSPFAFVVAALGATKESHMYLDSSIVLSRALEEHNSRYPLAVLVEEGNTFSIDRLTKGCKNCFVCEVTKINASLTLPVNWQFAMSKLYSWNLLQFKKVVYLDADTLPMTNVDELFDYPGLAMAPNWCALCCKHTKTNLANSGVMVIEPDQQTFELLLHKSFVSTLDDQYLISSTLSVTLLPDPYGIPLGYVLSSCGCHPSPNASFLEAVQTDPLGLSFNDYRAYHPGVLDQFVKIAHFSPEKGWKFLGGKINTQCGVPFFEEWERVYKLVVQEIGP